MKGLVLTVTLLLCSTLQAYAEDNNAQSVITVSGKAEIQVVPDEVVISLDVTKLNKDMQIAKRLNDESVGKILALARQFSIPPQNVQTSQISVSMKYELIRDPNSRSFDDDGEVIGKRIFRGYEISKTVVIRLTDISRFEEFFTNLMNTGVSEINSVTFETSKIREQKDKAREMAMKAAREKALAMAGTIGQTIGKAINITEGSIGTLAYANYPAKTMANSVGVLGDDARSMTTIAPGTIMVEAQVTVSFMLN